MPPPTHAPTIAAQNSGTGAARCPGLCNLRARTRPSQSPVDGRASNAEELSDLGGGVLVTVVQVHEMSLLGRGEFRPLPTKPAFGLGDRHTLASTHPDQIGLELRDHAEHVEEQAPDWIIGVVRAATEIQSNPLAGELLGNVPCIRN